MPALEKLVNGHWVVAFHPVYAACRTIPDFSLSSGARYRSDVVFDAAPPGAKAFPQLELDSINGAYRLHTTWWEGRGIQSAAELGKPRNPRPVEAISNQFRMTLH
jgi:hypothetical protein